MSDVTDLPDYVEKIKAACLPDNHKDDHRNIMIGGAHMILILDVMMAMYSALEVCVEKHPNSGHQNKTLDIVDKMIKEISSTKHNTQ